VREKSQRRRYADLSLPLPLGLPPWTELSVSGSESDGACEKAIGDALMERIELSAVIQQNDENEVSLRVTIVLGFLIVLLLGYILVLSCRAIAESNPGTPLRTFFRFCYWGTLGVCSVFITIVNPAFWIMFVPVFGTVLFVKWACRRNDTEGAREEYQMVAQTEEDSKKPHVVEAIPVV